MQTGIHPEVHDVVFIDTSTGAHFIAKSTTKSEETMKIGDKEYFVIKIEVSSASHPFYTGKQKLIDTAGRVDKFMAKMKKAQAHAEKNVKKVDEDEVEVVAEERAKEESSQEEPKAEKEEDKKEEVAEKEPEESEEESTEKTTEEAAEK